MPSPSLPRPVLFAVLGQTVISAGTHLAAKQATALFAPAALVTLRLVLSGALALGLLAVLPAPRWPPRRTWAFLGGFGALAVLNQGLFLVGLSMSRATHGGLLYALTPLGVYLLNAALGRERLRGARVAGIALAFAGVAVVLLGRGLGDALGPLWGDLLILGAVAAWVAWTTEARAFSAEHGGLRASLWSLVAAGGLVLPAAPATVSLEALRAVPWLGWACLAYLVVLTSLVAYALWNYALARVEASRVAVFTNLQPVATALAAWAVLGEPLGWGVAAGGALIIAGVRLAQR